MTTNIEERITNMAACGLNPYVIEERLGMEHYTIHIKYHHALMNGYTVAPASGRVHTLSAKEKAERKRQRAREYQAEKRAERKAKRKSMTEEERLARRRESDKRFREEHREEINAKARERYRNLDPEKKKDISDRVTQWQKGHYDRFKDKRNARRRELRRLKKEQANAEKQEAAQGVQAPSDSENRLLLFA